MEILRLSIRIAAMLLMCSVALAQQEAPFLEHAQKKFEYGLLQFELSHWTDAAKSFEDVAQKLPVNHRTTAAFVMAARAFLFEGQTSRSLRLIEELDRRFPASDYLTEGYLIAGDAAIAAGSRSTALRWYVQAWLRNDGDHILLSERIAALNPDEIPTGERRIVRAILKNNPADPSLEDLLGWDNASSRASIQETTQGNAPTAHSVRSAPEPRIVVALPLHEKNSLHAGIIRDIRDGILAAMDLHRAEEKGPVAIELIDSGNEDSLRPALARIERDESAMILIAGAFSEDAERVSRLAAERGILVLLPTATAEGLTKLGSNIFQLNTPILQRARLLAEYTYLELNAQEAIVLAPDHSYAKEMADAFMERCRSLHIPVRLAGRYGAGTESVASLCSRLAQSRVKNCILFAPVQSRDDIVAVLQGMHDAQIDIPIVGGGNWNHPDLLSRYGKGLTIFFESDVVEDKSTKLYGQLKEAFSKRSSRQISRETLFGFDAMQIALSLLHGSSLSRKLVRKRIVDVFEGLRAPVNFMQQRVNASINILRCANGVLSVQEAFHAK